MEGVKSNELILNNANTITSTRARKVYFLAVASLAFVLFCLAPKVFLLFFCCILFATFLTAVCGFIERHTAIKRKWSLTITITLLLGLSVLTGWLLGAQITEQFSRLGKELPRAISYAQEQISSTTLGAQLLQGAKSADQLLGRAPKAVSTASTALSSMVGVFVQLFVVFFVGLYLAANPALYVEGFARLFPAPKRRRIADILYQAGNMLKGWLFGRLLLMGSNGLVTAVGLWILGVPLALSLGLISALLNFVPNFGPWIAAVPAVLIALMEGTSKALQVAIFYLVYQMFDGFVLTPLVQSRTSTIPSAMVLMSQVLFGVLYGALGVLVAVPLAAVAMVLLRELHVKDVLREPA